MLENNDATIFSCGLDIPVQLKSMLNLSLNFIFGFNPEKVLVSYLDINSKEDVYDLLKNYESTPIDILKKKETTI